VAGAGHGRGVGVGDRGVRELMAVQLRFDSPELTYCVGRCRACGGVLGSSQGDRVPDNAGLTAAGGLDWEQVDPASPEYRRAPGVQACTCPKWTPEGSRN
jgi:hypothetical protein